MQDVLARFWPQLRNWPEPALHPRFYVDKIMTLLDQIEKIDSSFHAASFINLEKTQRKSASNPFITNQGTEHSILISFRHALEEHEVTLGDHISSPYA